MNGDPNTARDDVLGALALIEATIEGMPDSPDKLRLAFASSALRRANEKLRGCHVCGGYGCDACPDNVVPLFPDGYSVKVKLMAVSTIYDPAQNLSVLYCNTDDHSFGPVFPGVAAADFLDWISDRGRDPRAMNDNTLDIWVQTWKTESGAEA